MNENHKQWPQLQKCLFCSLTKRKVVTDVLPKTKRQFSPVGPIKGVTTLLGIWGLTAKWFVPLLHNWETSSYPFFNHHKLGRYFWRQPRISHSTETHFFKANFLSIMDKYDRCVFLSSLPSILIGVAYHSLSNYNNITHMRKQFVLDNMGIIFVSSKLMGLHELEQKDKDHLAL